jgi:hypothetical protein
MSVYTVRGIACLIGTYVETWIPVQIGSGG